MMTTMVMMDEGYSRLLHVVLLVAECVLLLL